MRCVAGKGKEMDHKRPTPEHEAANAHALPQFGVDYAFFIDKLELIEGGRHGSDEAKTMGKPLAP